MDGERGNKMKFTIKSRKPGHDLEFSRPGEYYIYVDLNGKSGSLGDQICDGGELLGATIGFNGDDEANFERICRNWYRSYLRKHGGF